MMEVESAVELWARFVDSPFISASFFAINTKPRPTLGPYHRGRQAHTPFSSDPKPAPCTLRCWPTQGLGVSNLFHFFLLQSDGVSRGPIERKASVPQETPANATEPADVSLQAVACLLDEVNEVNEVCDGIGAFQDCTASRSLGT